MSGQGSAYSSSTGYPGHRKQQQESASSYSYDDGSSSDSSRSSGQHFGKIAAAVPMATHDERHAAISRFTSDTPDYGHPHHKIWATPGASPASSWEPEPSHWLLSSTTHANPNSHTAPGPAPLLAHPSAGTPSIHARSSSGEARQHYAAVQPSGLRHEITSPPTTPGVNPGAYPHNYYAVPASQASSGARYNPSTRCNYCGDVVELAKLEVHTRACPRNPHRAQQSAGSRVPAAPVTVLAHHQWNAGGTPAKRPGNP